MHSLDILIWIAESFSVHFEHFNTMALIMPYLSTCIPVQKKNYIN